MVNTLATTVASEAGVQSVPVTRGVVSQVPVVGDNPLLSCGTDATVVNVGACDVAVDQASESETDAESDVDDSGSASDSDVTIPGDDTTNSLPALQGRFISLSDYLPETEMPDISFSNPANFWYSS